MVRWSRGAMTALALLGLLAACTSQGRESLPVYGGIPSFSLTDQIDRTLTDEDIRGKVVLANFIFTTCTQSCPVLSPRMAELQEQLGEDGVLGQEVLLLSFSVDPEHDTPEVLQAYAQRYGTDHDSWRLLTGSPAAMRRVITDGFKLAFGQMPGRTEHVHDDGSAHFHEYDVAHTNRVVLGDRAGRVRAYYDGASDWDMAQVLKDVRNLLN